MPASPAAAAGGGGLPRLPDGGYDGAMTAKATASARRRRAAAVVAVGMAAVATAALLAACTAPQVADVLHAGGKIAYDSMKARQQSQ